MFGAVAPLRIACRSAAYMYFSANAKDTVYEDVDHTCAKHLVNFDFLASALRAVRL